MKERDIVIGKMYTVKRGLPDSCWREIHLSKDDWEGKPVTIVGPRELMELGGPTQKLRTTMTVWDVSRVDGSYGICWLPAYALSGCMFE